MPLWVVILLGIAGIYVVAVAFWFVFAMVIVAKAAKHIDGHHDSPRRDRKVRR